MSNMYYDEEDDQSGENPRDLRKQRDKLAKTIADQNAVIAELKARDAKRTIADTFQARGVDPRYARFAAKEIEDVTDESVASWITENSDLIGVQADTPPAVDEQQQLLQQQQAASYNRMASVEQYGLPSIDMSDFSQFESMSDEEVDRMISSNGGI